jgi:enterochelin esterase-like enzyme
MRFPVILFLAAASCPAADPVFDLAWHDPQSAGFRAALEKLFPEKELKAGTAVFAEGPLFLWAVDAQTEPELLVDDHRFARMSRLEGSTLWFATGSLRTGTSHKFHYMMNGQPFGGRTDVAAYGPDSYAKPGAPQGKLSEKLLHTSKIYDGMVSEYWIYVPAQYDPGIPVALMVWQDGRGSIERNGPTRTLNVIDNLIQQKKIPVMIQVFIQPGMRGAQAMRSIEYDTMDDTYARFLRDELVAEVQSKYNIRRDAYSRGIAGNSSGGICSFNVAWRQPDQFSRVLSRIGSFTSIQWKPGVLDGGNVFPFLIRKSPKKNIRVWLQDGSGDLENNHGSWPLQNIQMANSLKMMGYDFHLSWGNGTHNGAHGNAEMPEELTWLWRDYDPSKTEQDYQQDPAEKTKPPFRVTIFNRE